MALVYRGAAGCPLEAWVVWMVVIRCLGCRLERARYWGLGRRPGCPVSRGLVCQAGPELGSIRLRRFHGVWLRAPVWQALFRP